MTKTTAEAFVVQQLLFSRNVSCFPPVLRWSQLFPSCFWQPSFILQAAAIRCSHIMAGNRYTSDVQLNLERDVSRAIELLDRLQRTEYNAWIGKDVDVGKLRDLQSVSRHRNSHSHASPDDAPQILKSDFFNSVRQVYEKVYETVDMSGSPEIRASATAKATVAVFASASANRDSESTRIVELPKTEEGLGFNIMGGKEQNCPIYVSRIIPGGIADRSSSLRRGDQLLSVNGVSVDGESHEKAVNLLKSARERVTLIVKYTPRILEEMECKYEKSGKRRPAPQVPGK